MLAVIGGSGLGRLPGLEVSRRLDVATPYGEPSAALTFGTVRRGDVVFLARHGDAHSIPPHAINYRANIWALHALGVKDVLAVATVGGIRADLAPGALALPDQIIDYTHGRAATYFDGGGSGVTHVDFTHPYCEALRQKVAAAAAAAGERLVAGCTYAATQGPRLETKAEVDRLQRDGGDVIGMTGMPEAALARELGLCYAAIAVVVNHAAGRGSSADGISLDRIDAVAERAMKRVHRIIESLAGAHGG